jgi:threonylcarbamoyladenosine tRNA methylthiotransferase MtaB
MSKICVFTLGCKVNQCESDSLIRGLVDLGYAVTDELEFADLYIVNTCAVTGEAEKKSRQMRARIFAINPDARIIFTGCATEKDPDSFISKDNVQLVTGTFNKGEILNMLSDSGVKISEHTKVYEDMLTPSSLRARTYVKVQDGCDNFCSYCIIPYLRGRSRSRSIDSIVAEIEETKPTECVLNGINISDYHYNGVNLAGLLEALTGFDTRFRIGSLEVGVISDEFLLATKKLKNFAPHFHLSLQSGSDAVLKKMNRHYTTDEYLQKVNLIKKYYPLAGITTDIIVGFPTETDNDVDKTIEFISKVGFSDIHPFPFSPRSGTLAYKMKDLPGNIKKQRLDRLIKAKNECRDKFFDLNMDKTLSVLIESIDGDYAVGYSENYIRVYIDDKNFDVNTFFNVKPITKFKDGLLCKPL